MFFIGDNMPRKSRITWFNHPHLVVSKANGGASLFVDDSDYQFYISILRQMVRDRLLRVFAYCLLQDEVRLVVEPTRMNLSRLIQRLHGRHTSRMNQKLGRIGHLFRGRFHSVIFPETELLKVVRSVHLWPVRQGLLRRPELYPYSSHASIAYMNVKTADFLTAHRVLALFLGDLEAKKRAFVRFVEMAALEPDDWGVEEIIPGVGGNKEEALELLVKAKMVQKERPKKSSVKILAERASLLLSISHEQLLSSSRRQDLVMARRLLATAAVLGAERSVTEVAHYLNRDKAQISRLVAQGMDLLENNEAFILMYESLKARGAIRELMTKNLTEYAHSLE